MERFETLAATKLLSYNLDKSLTVIVGSKKAREKLAKEFEEKPPKLYGKPMKIGLQGSYLGEEIYLNCKESITEIDWGAVRGGDYQISGTTSGTKAECGRTIYG